VQVWSSLQVVVLTLNSTDTWVLSTPPKFSKLRRKKDKVINQKFVAMQDEEPGHIHRKKNQQMTSQPSCLLAHLVQLFLPLQISHITGLSHPYPHHPGSHLCCAEATDDHKIYHGTAPLLCLCVCVCVCVCCVPILDSRNVKPSL